MQLPDTALPSVFADEQRLEQILSILLDNAHSYAPEGSSVQLRVDQCEEGKTRFWVVDHGPGIPDEEKASGFPLLLSQGGAATAGTKQSRALWLGAVCSNGIGQVAARFADRARHAGRWRDFLSYGV